jgi:histone H3/H4
MPTILPFDAFDLGEEEVRSRFGWAVRQGHPHWLWPGTTIESWQAALGQFEVVARQILTTGAAQDPLHGRPEDIGVAGYTSGMGPLLGHWLKEGKLEADESIAAVLDLHLRHNSRRMARMARRARTIVTALAARGVPVLVLKGMETAFRYFPTPGARAMSDIDLAIRLGDAPRAAEALGAMGLIPGAFSPTPPQQQTWRAAKVVTLPRSLALTHADDPWSVDLQTSLNRKYSSGSPILRLDTLWAGGSTEPWVLSASAEALSLEAQALHLACHASCGFGNLSMLRLCELAFVVRASARQGGFDWDEFIALAHRAEAFAAAYPALRLTEQLAPGTVPDRVLDAGRAETPAAVLRVMRGLSPANAQRVLRWSLEERFMWARSAWHVVQEVARDIVAPAASPALLFAIQKKRLFRVLRGTVTWHSQGSR